MRVLVLDGNENQAVACVRSLARAGHAVSVGADTGWSKAGWSRRCRETFVYPAPQQDAAAFVARVAEEAARASGTLVLPLTERTTLPLSAARAQVLEAGGRMVLPPHETVLRAFDKEQTTRLAASLGVAVPRTELIADGAQARAAAASLPFPVVLKPRSSEEVSADGKVTATGAPLYARDAREFLSAYAEVSRRARAVLAQEFVAGEGAGYFALMRGGELRAEFAHRRLRDVRPTGSGSAVRVSVEPDARVREAALAILGALGWHGVAMVEFRVRADGVPVFLEVNGRFWNSLALAVYAGVDFPALVAEMAERGDVRRVGGYRAGVRCRWLLGDARHAAEVLRGAPRGYPVAFPSRLRTLVNLFVPVRGTFHDNFASDDPLPELGDWVDFLFRRLPAGARRKRRDAGREGLDAQGSYSRT
ncbi:MAG: ATP-grasp domain-containing protein [Acidobacteria bacterium]|nr:ATP-grasp domain-containing protein [Acidobacteriota bacterium]